MSDKEVALKTINNIPECVHGRDSGRIANHGDNPQKQAGRIKTHAQVGKRFEKIFFSHGLTRMKHG
jgi:hypothetical protein